MTQSTLPLILLYIVLALMEVLISVLIGYAAKRKDRSFWSFFILSVLMGAVIPALVVAALPFRIDDPRRPRGGTT